MTEYILIDNEKYRLKILLNEKDFDYYTDIWIELLYGKKKLILFKDNLLALKNIVKEYDKEVCSLDNTLEEKSLGLLLNEYYRCSYEEQLQEGIVLDEHGQWIGERYCCFTYLNCATWVYRYAENIIIKVTPIFCGFEEDDYTEEYSDFVVNYKDIFKEISSLQELRTMKENVFKLYNKFFY